jgi:hypothetical protein
MYKDRSKHSCEVHGGQNEKKNRFFIRNITQHSVVIHFNMATNARKYNNPPEGHDQEVVTSDEFHAPVAFARKRLGGTQSCFKYGGF